VQKDEVCLVLLQQLSRMLLQIQMRVQPLSHIEVAAPAVRQPRGHKLDSQPLEGPRGISPQAITLRHVAVGAVKVRPVAAVQCASVDRAVRVVPANNGGPPACALGIMKDRAAPVQRMPPMYAVIVHLERVIEPVAEVVYHRSAQQRRHNLHCL